MRLIGAKPVAINETKAPFLPARSQQTISSENDRQRQLVRCPDRNRPEGQGECDIDRLADQAEQPALWHVGEPNRNVLQQRHQSEGPDLQFHACIEDGLQKQKPEQCTGNAQRRKSSALRLPPDDAGRRSERVQHQKLHRSNQRIGRGRQRAPMPPGTARFKTRRPGPLRSAE